MNRRDFLKMSAGAVILAGIGGGAAKALIAPEKEKSARAQSGSLERRKLGSLEVSSVGLGCLPMVGYYGGKYDKKDMIALIRQAYDEGVTFFDTAEVYGPHTSDVRCATACKSPRNSALALKKDSRPRSTASRSIFAKRWTAL